MQRTDEDEARVVLETKDVLDMSLLHRAAMFDHPEVVQYLIDQVHDYEYDGSKMARNLKFQKAEIEATDQEKRTPLLLAVACSGFRAFRTLLLNGANISAVDRNKRNILHYLVGRSYLSAFSHEEFLTLCEVSGMGQTLGVMIHDSSPV